MTIITPITIQNPRQTCDGDGDDGGDGDDDASVFDFDHYYLTCLSPFIILQIPPIIYS